MEAHTRSPPSLPARALPPEVILPCDLPSWPTVQARMLQLQVILLHQALSTTSQNQLWSRFGKLFFPSSPDVPALLPSAMLPRQARGTHKKQFTKPTPQFILGRSTYLADGGVAGGHEEGDGVLQQVEPLPPLAQVAEEVELRLLNLVRQDRGGVRDVLLQRLVVAVPPFEVINIHLSLLFSKGLPINHIYNILRCFDPLLFTL